MPKHAEQHFVPQFYLRNFSEDKKRLHLANIARAKVILNASLRKQCARTKFYDFAPDTETDLAKLEDRAAPIIRGIIRNDRFLQPDKEYDRYVTLILFVVVQHLRGLRTAEANDQMTDYYAKLMFAAKAQEKNFDLSKVKIGNKFPAAIPLNALPDVMPSAMRLRPNLMINKSGVDFMTSDDPVLLHNQYCEGIDYQGVLGWDSKGVQVFIALSPRHMLILYDETIYRMGSRKNHLQIEITNPAEVDQFNAMQVMHAYENIYFCNPKDADRAQQFVATYAKHRPKRPMTIVESAINEQADGTGKSLLHNFRPLLRQKLRVPAIRLQPGIDRVDLDSRGRLIGRPKSYWKDQKGFVRYEISRIIGAYDDLEGPLMPATPRWNGEPPTS